MTMAPNLYKRINQAIQKHQLTSITVDVFDTLLLHDYWPADLRYYDIAVRWLPTINRLISPNITTYELYNERISVKRTLDDERLSSRIDIWFDVLIDALCDKYNIDLSEETRFELLTSLMAIELEFEISNTKPNLALLRQLSAIKADHPKLKLYFVADSHLMSEQLKTLLKMKGITLFDNGVSSADHNKTKANGELYEQLADEFGAGFNLATNIHIGDRRDPDFLAPRQHDSLAIHYRPIRLRGLRTIVGQTWLSYLQKVSLYHDKRQFADLDNYSTWYNYGAIASELHKAWSEQLSCLVKIHSYSEIIIAGQLLCDAKPILSQYHYVHFAPDFNKLTLIQAFLWLLAASSTNQWDREQLLRLLMWQESLSRLDLYRICFSSTYAYSEFAINSFSDTDFLPLFLQELLNADQTFSEPARQAYAKIANFLPSNDKNIVILQIPNDNTAELFSNFARLHNVTNPIRAIIFDQDSSISTHQTAIASLLNTRRQDLITLGATETITWQHDLSSTDYYRKILLPQYKRIARKILKTAA